MMGTEIRKVEFEDVESVMRALPKMAQEYSVERGVSFREGRVLALSDIVDHLNPNLKIHDIAELESALSYARMEMNKKYRADVAGLDRLVQDWAKGVFAPKIGREPSFTERLEYLDHLNIETSRIERWRKAHKKKDQRAKTVTPQGVVELPKVNGKVAEEPDKVQKTRRRAKEKYTQKDLINSWVVGRANPKREDRSLIDTVVDILKGVQPGETVVLVFSDEKAADFIVNRLHGLVLREELGWVDSSGTPAYASRKYPHGQIRISRQV